ETRRVLRHCGHGARHAACRWPQSRNLGQGCLAEHSGGTAHRLGAAPHSDERRAGARRQGAGQTSAPARIARRTGGVGRMTTPARLLIVDDEAAQLRALCDTLRLEGYTTQGYGSGQEALAALSPGEFDLLLTDLMMPVMDGITLIDAAK